MPIARVRSSRPACIRASQECGAEEVGELLIRLREKPLSPLGDFRGYTDATATDAKVLRDVFRRGDRFYRSGDLMRFDDNDYFYFVDRIGDTFRWKGENVSTAEVEAVIGRAPGVDGVAVASVSVPGMEGRAGLAALETSAAFDLAAFWDVAQVLPQYAQPCFVRVRSRLATTGTFKVQKTQLRLDGADPSGIEDPMYVRQAE